MRSLACVLAAFLTFSVAPWSSAQDAGDDAARSSARQLANEASDAYHRGDFEAAYDGFNRAFRLVGVPSLGVWSARSLRQLGRWVEATERYREVTRLRLPDDAPESSRQALREAEAELTELLPRIPSLVITLENADPEHTHVYLDGQRVPSALLGAKQRLDPGTHRITATRGAETQAQEVTVAERTVERVRLVFAPETSANGALDPARPPPPGAKPGRTAQQTVGLITLGAGGVFLLGGAVTTFLALQEQKDLRAQCTPAAPGASHDYECGPGQHASVDRFDTLKTLSYVGFVGAGVLGAAGATLYLTGKPNEGDASVALWFGGSAAGVRGAF